MHLRNGSTLIGISLLLILPFFILILDIKVKSDKKDRMYTHQYSWQYYFILLVVLRDDIFI